MGHQPERVTTDKHASYPRAIRHILGRKVYHRTNQYLNNRIEQDHRQIKQRYYPMRGCGSFAAAARFCAVFDELRHFFGSDPRLATLTSLYLNNIKLSNTDGLHCSLSGK